MFKYNVEWSIKVLWLYRYSYNKKNNVRNANILILRTFDIKSNTTAFKILYFYLAQSKRCQSKNYFLRKEMSDKINQILWSPDFAPSSMMILLLKRLSSISSLDTFIFLAMSILSIFFSHCFDGLRLFFLDCPLLQATIVKKDNRTNIKGIFIIVLPFSTSFTCSFLVLCI